MRLLLVAICLATVTLVRPGPLRAQAARPTLGAQDSVLVLPRVDVVGKRSNLEGIPGSANVLEVRWLERSRVFTTSEALRKLPGVAARDEEGLALRPNLGIRGLNPTRSTKVTLLEDGVPLSYAPYGDNASYYHPPVERFEMIEVLKGAGQVLFGPQTIGGLINYVTPLPPKRFSGFVSGGGGNRDYATGRVRAGGHGVMLDYIRKQSDGARANMRSELDDLNLKALVGRSLTLRTNYYRESSTLTYSGLTQAEFDLLGPRYNPFKNDAFEGRRFGSSATHNLTLGPSTLVTTNAYVSHFARDWWRQSSTTTDAQGGPGVAGARLAGAPIDPDTIRSVQGRLREYITWGIEPRVRLAYSALGAAHELHAGFRAHFERQDRKQVNGTSPTARQGTLTEDNLRRTEAYSAFLASRVRLGRWSLTPGLRYEHIRSRRANLLPGGTGGSDVLGRWIPSLGATWNPGPPITVFAGVHRGFAPPRTEDVIASTGTSTELGPEQSTNIELGARLESAGDELQVTFFRNDFDRLIAVGSVAGGSTPLAQGEARFTGAEISGGLRHSRGLYLRCAYTWLPEAEQSTPFRQVVGGAVIAGSAAGNRQPYAPAHLLSAAAGLEWRGLDGQIEAVHVGGQFADFANTAGVSADGQRGVLGASTVWNAALNYDVPVFGTTAYVAVKNLANRVHVVDRTRGIQVGAPRLVQAGLHYAFGR